MRSGRSVLLGIIILHIGQFVVIAVIILAGVFGGPRGVVTVRVTIIPGEGFCGVNMDAFQFMQRNQTDGSTFFCGNDFFDNDRIYPISYVRRDMEEERERVENSRIGYAMVTAIIDQVSEGVFELQRLQRELQGER